MATIGQPKNVRDAQAYYFQRNDPLEVGITTVVGASTNIITSLSGDGNYYGGVTYNGGDSSMGECFAILGRKNHSLQIAGTFTGLVVTPMVSNDGITFIAAPGVTPPSAAGIVQFTGLWKFIYFHIAATTLASLSVTYIGVA